MGSDILGDTKSNRYQTPNNQTSDIGWGKNWIMKLQLFKAGKLDFHPCPSEDSERNHVFHNICEIIDEQVWIQVWERIRDYDNNT